ncbi:hypothetical protein F5884DRAFT_238253 [Xylogone sp. PMI_703]|nr:hypothetical protein F5884DRAFT_238253 [Xylogone sp. PMI_703]
MPLILPKGIVVNNSPQIETSIEQIDQEPLELKDIAKFWKVYTTTQRRLLDPTAERLENYWWRIWGSEKKTLQAATVAKLFAHISNGETIVPLRGPPNRDESGPFLTKDSRNGPGASSSTILQQPSPTRRSTASSSVASKGTTAPPHPILKKSRGPSSSGPRPTARFISPHESQDEPEPEQEPEPNSPPSPGPNVMARPPSPPVLASEKKRLPTKPVGKKKGQVFVASAAASKKRPVLMRRQGSQNSHSSTDSATKPPETAQVDANPSQAACSPPNTTEPAVAVRGKQAPSRVQEAPKISRRSSGTVPSAKKHSTGTNAVTKRHPQAGNAQGSRLAEQESWVEVSHESQLTEHQSEQSTTTSEHNNNSSNVKRPQQNEGPQSQRTVSQEAPRPNNVAKEDIKEDKLPPSSTSHRLAVRHPHRQMSDGDRIQSGASKRPSIRETRSASTLTPAPRESSREATVTSKKGKEKEVEQPRQAEMFAKRPVPPVADKATPKPTFSGPLTKSKSQLTLLLEEDRAKSGKQESSSRRHKR